MKIIKKYSIDGKIFHTFPAMKKWAAYNLPENTPVEAYELVKDEIWKIYTIIKQERRLYLSTKEDLRKEWEIKQSKKQLNLFDNESNTKPMD